MRCVKELMAKKKTPYIRDKLDLNFVCIYIILKHSPANINIANYAKILVIATMTIMIMDWKGVNSSTDHLELQEDNLKH